MKINMTIVKARQHGGHRANFTKPTSRMAVLGTPSSTSIRRIFLSASVSPEWTSRALYLQSWFAPHHSNVLEYHGVAVSRDVVENGHKYIYIESSDAKTHTTPYVPCPIRPRCSYLQIEGQENEPCRCGSTNE